MERVRVTERFSRPSSPVIDGRTRYRCNRLARSDRVRHSTAPTPSPILSGNKPVSPEVPVGALSARSRGRAVAGGAAQLGSRPTRHRVAPTGPLCGRIRRSAGTSSPPWTLPPIPRSSTACICPPVQMLGFLLRTYQRSKGPALIGRWVIPKSSYRIPGVGMQFLQSVDRSCLVSFERLNFRPRGR